MSGACGLSCQSFASGPHWACQARPFLQRLTDDSASSLAANLGSIDFPNSGATEAQTAFLTGMKALHSFEFEDAGEAFLDAQAIDSDFGLAYWGEALSHNHPLWSEQDREAALCSPGPVCTDAGRPCQENAVRTREGSHGSD